MNEEKRTKVRELVEQGKVMYSLDKFDEAFAYFKEAEAIDPYAEEIYENTAICAIMCDKFDKAKESLKRLLLVNKNSGTAYFHLGNIALLEGNAKEAKAHYSKAELCGFTNPAMCVNLATFYEESGEIDNAIAQYRKILQANPYDYDTLGRITELYIRNDMAAEAFNAAKAMVQTDIDEFAGHHFMYVSLLMLEKNDDAAKYLEDTVARFPDNETARFDRIRLMDVQGKTDEALELLDKEYSTFKDIKPVALLKLGLLLQKQMHSEAMKLVEETECLKEEPQAQTMMYSLYFSLGNYSKALEYCNLLEKFGKETPYYSAIAYFKPLAELKLGQEDALEHFKNSAAELKQAAIDDPKHIDLNMYRALCEYQLGNISESIRLMEYVVAVIPNEAVFHLLLSKLYEVSGNNAAADSEKEIAIRLDSSAVLPLM